MICAKGDYFMNQKKKITIGLIISLVLVGIFSYGLISNYSEKKVAKTNTEAETYKVVKNVKQPTVSIETKLVSKVAKSFNTDTTKKAKKVTKKVTKKKAVKKSKKILKKKIAKKKTKKLKSKLKSLGTFKLTAYCGCGSCCGSQGGTTASGARPRVGRTIAVDTSVIPFGTHVIINGHEYVAEDRGGAINGNRIDVFFGDHGSAMDFGVQYAEVFIKK